MMKYIIIILLFSNWVNAQKNKIDSLYELKYSELKNKFYDYYDHIKVQQSEQIAQYYLQKAKKEKNILEIAEGYNLMHFNKDFPTALKYVDSLAARTKNITGNLYPARTYLIKGNLYYKNDNLKSALDNYILGLKYAKEQNDERQTAYANMNIAYINSYIDKNAEAAKTFRHYVYNRNDIIDDYQHNQMRMALISCYIDINKLDSANILINEGQKYAFINKNNYDSNLYSYLSATFDLKLKKYDSAITKLLNVYTYITNSDEKSNTNQILYSLGKAYEGAKNKEKAVEVYIKLDSIVQKSDITFPELREVYTYLIDYYKESNNKEKQLYYIDRFLQVDKKLDEQFKYLSTEVPKKYDTPNLLQEKEDIIQDLKNRKTILSVSVFILIVILTLLGYLYYKAKKTEKKHRKIAQELIQKFEKKDIVPIDTKSEFSLSPTYDEVDEIVEEVGDIETETDQVVEKTAKIIPEDVKISILKELEAFETKELYLKKGITLVNLAKKIKTNTAYLSETINSNKGKNFNSYLNDLRIDYVLKRLIEDKKFRSYKLPAIAEEIGYNNVQAFSVAFKKKTGTTTSIYIKEIEKSIIS
ncbi:MAG: helix-turn-helix domain-containing protein [Chryseobacterium sp.]|uniref:helix-turn-helix domain-containing protein n=1 Tax=Chryseobacterium sp. TaxID=1871047 RepID=UPI003D0DA136